MTLTEQLQRVSTPRRGAPLEVRFWSKVKKTETCWEWTGATTPSGYGQIWNEGKAHLATRVSYELWAGKPWPIGLLACHHCDNPICVRPEHIFPGTVRDNNLDAVSKGRMLPPHKCAGYKKPAPATHCKRNHEFTAENTLRQGAGKRKCKSCQLASEARYREKRRVLLALEAAKAELSKLEDE